MDPSEIQKIAHLARIEVSEDVAKDTASSITDILKFVDQLQSVDTEGVIPMSHPLDAVQRLRADKVSEEDVRDQFQAIAPEAESGLYLVPKVID